MMNQYKTMLSRANEEHARSVAYTVKPRSEGAEQACAYPTCTDKAWRDHFCWDHYQHEYYTGR